MAIPACLNVWDEDKDRMDVCKYSMWSNENQTSQIYLQISKSMNTNNTLKLCIEDYEKLWDWMYILVNITSWTSVSFTDSSYNINS